MAKTDVENVRKAQKVPVLATGAGLDTGFGDPIRRHDHDRGQRCGERAAAPRRFGREAADGQIRGRPRLCAQKLAALVRRDRMTVAEIRHAGKTKT